MKGLYYLIFLFFISKSFAQKEANVWITGNDFGIDFNYNRFRVFDRESYGESLAAETSVSISNKETGQLLFYSNGFNVWDRNFHIMPNGRNLIGGRLFGQYTLIIPMPGTLDRYYLFTLKRSGDADDNGLYYTVIDMSLNGGLGDVVPGTKNTLLLANPLEVLTGTIHDNGKDFWLLTHEDGTDRFVVYPITAQGIMPPVFYPFGLAYDGYKNGGMIQLSPDRSMMAFNISRNISGHKDENSPLEWYDFDPSTGTISNRRVLGEFSSIKSILFSPNNSKLYFGSYNWDEPALYNLLWQYDLSAGSLDEIIQSLDSTTWGFKLADLFSTPVPLPSFKLQLAPDGRLYNGAMGRQQIGNQVSRRMLFYLDRPNAPLRNAEPKFRFLETPNNTFHGPISGVFEQAFPNFMQYYFNGLEPIDNSLTPGECAGIRLTVYPNPSEDFVSIKSSIENCLFPANIKIYNASGQFLQEAKVFSEPFPQIDIRTYPRAVYFMIIETFNRTEVKKVIKR